MATPEMNYFIDCNGQNILINDEAPNGPELCGDWGGDQCAGCGIDIIETGKLVGLREVVCTNCGARYPVQSEEAR
jgi:hypothetical protein